MNAIGIIDECRLLRECLAIVIENIFEDVTVFKADSVDSCRELYPECAADLIILGVKYLPWKNSLNCIEEIKRYYSDSRIIIYDDELNSQFDVNSCVTKQSSVEELLDCVTFVLKDRDNIN